MYVRDDPSLKWPEKLKIPPEKGFHKKYCRFHRDHSHNTEDCVDLKDQIEVIIQQGRLRRFIATHTWTFPRVVEESLSRKNPEFELLREIKFITRGSARGGESTSARKAHTQTMRSSSKQVYITNRPRKCPRIFQEDITFTEEDSREVQHPHDNALVVMLIIANHRTRRILINNGSSADILYVSTFEHMGISKNKLRPATSPLMGFTGDKLYPVGVITLPITTRVSPHQVTKAVDFLVVDYPLACNAIIDRPTLNKMKAITSTYHLLMRSQLRKGSEKSKVTRQ